MGVLRNSLDEGQSAFFTQEGQMKSMAEIAQVLHDATDGLSDEEKNNTQTTIFMSDAMRTALGLAEMTADEFNAMKTTIR